MKKGLLKLGVLLSAAAITVTTVSIAPQAEQNYQQIVYVDAQKGRDGGTGTKSSPFKTIDAAKDYVKKINKNMTGDIFVDIAPGEYYIEETLNFDASDSGTNGYDVIYGTSAEEKPLLTGGKHVEGEWKVVDSEKNIYAIPYDGPKYVRQIYVNDVRAQRAWTEGEYELMDDSNSVKTKDGYTTEFTDILNWRNISDIEFSFVRYWTNSLCAISSIKSREDGKIDILMDAALWKVLNESGRNGIPTMPWRIENAYELMDEPGEFYYDRTLKELYYIPRAGDDMATADVVVPYTERLVSVVGVIDEKAEHIVFKNLKFSHTAWYDPDVYRGWADAQNNLFDPDRTLGWLPSTVYVEFADYIDFYDCEISHVGGSGLTYQSASHDCEIIGNNVYDVAAGGMHFGHVALGGNSFEGDLRHDVYNFEVRNNWVHETGHSYRDSAGITVGYVSHANFIHNEVGNMAYSGFHVNWDWAGGLVKGKPFTNVHVDDNYIYNTMHGTPVNDGAAVYTLGVTGGSHDNYNTVSRNYIRQSVRTGQSGGLYTDEGSSYWELEDNVVDFYDAYHNEVGSKISWSQTWIYTNTFIYYRNCHVTDNADDWYDAGTETYAYDTTYVTECNWSDEAKAIIANAGLEPEYRAKMGGGKTRGFEKLILHNGENGYVDDGSNDGRTMRLDVGETRNFTYTAHNTWAEVVPQSDYSVEFKSLTPDIIDVTNNSVTAKAVGHGYMEFTVTYDGGKTQTRRVHVMCGDDLASVRFKDKTNVLLMDAELPLLLECTSALGNPITDYDVTYRTSNPDIATVSSKGVVKVVGEGDVEITAVVTADGTTVEQKRVITCTELKKFDTTGLKVTQINDLFNDPNGWYKGSKNVVVSNTKKDTMRIETPSSFSVYSGRTFENELLSFNAVITGPENGWPSIVFGQTDPQGYAISNTNTYIICIKPDQIELQRFNKGKRTMLFGIFGGNEGEYGILPNTYITYGKEANIQVGSFTQPDGNVRLILNVNGYNVFDVIDYLDNRVTGPGYFGIINQGGSTTLTKAAEVSADSSDKKQGFVDINKHWAKASINELYNNGFVAGVTETQFAPNNTITRAEFIAIVARIGRLTSSNGDSGFADVSPTAWYATSVAGAIEAGIIDSHFEQNGCFNPNAPIRRDEMAALLVLAYNCLTDDYPQDGDISKFADAGAVEPWAVAYMKNAVGGGLMYGNDLNCLNPQGSATRAEAAAMLQRFAEMVK